MNEQEGWRRRIRIVLAVLIVDSIALLSALVLRSLPLMLLALAIQALAGIGLFSIIRRGRRPGPFRSWPPPDTRI